jgi:hypothetical protein
MIEQTVSLPCGGRMWVEERRNPRSQLPYGYRIDLVNVPIELKAMRVQEPTETEDGTMAISNHWSIFVAAPVLKTLRVLIEQELERRGEK